MSRQMILPPDFHKSYLDRGQYPVNLIHSTIGTYPSILKEYRKRLDDAAGSLFERDLMRVEVSLRDIKADNGTGEDDHLNAHSPQRLNEYLHILAQDDKLDATSSPICVDRRDPKCRFIYIYAPSGRAKLRLTRSMLVQILTFHQIMPDYIDFMTVFGEQEDAKDLGFSSFREQVNVKGIHKDLHVEALARSGRQYQLCHNLKGVSRKERADGGDTFSVRSAAFYHRFDVENGNALWLVTKGGLDIEGRFIELTGDKARPEDKSFDTREACLRSSLSAHLLFCHWSTEDWRGYIKWLEHEIDTQTKMALLDPYEAGRHHRIYTTADVQDLLEWEEKIDDAITHLQANVEVIGSLRNFYMRLKRNRDIKELAEACADDIDVFANELENIINNFKLHISRAKALLKRISGRTELVKQHRLERLNHHMEHEAIVVRIITIVTLLYLPATFTSSFFSTDVVKYQDQPAGGRFSTLAMNRWLQVTLPLTFVTMLFAYWAWRWAERKAGGDQHNAWPSTKKWRDRMPSSLRGLSGVKSSSGSIQLTAYGSSAV